jgi:hypothetical protein
MKKPPGGYKNLTGAQMGTFGNLLFITLSQRLRVELEG